MVLDFCPEFYVSGKENLLWQPENEEHQRRRWLAPKVDKAPKPVSKVPKAVPAAVPGMASTCAPFALTSEHAHRTTQPATMASYVVGQTSPGRELSKTYATARSLAGFRQVPATHTLLVPAVSVLDRSRVPAFTRTIQQPAVPMKQVHQTAPRVAMRVIQPAFYMPVQAQAAPQVAYPVSRETSFLGYKYHPMACPVYYVNNRILPRSVIVRRVQELIRSGHERQEVKNKMLERHFQELESCGSSCLDKLKSLRNEVRSEVESRQDAETKANQQLLSNECDAATSLLLRATEQLHSASSGS
ncbi:unnamed protein product [Symbiodinium sp. CCMP2592]|nr:unnamed protein product [Symbiodinium sp. CCMP2592]